MLYSFCSASNCTDGANPYDGVIRDSAGNLYGTTPGGGANDKGTVYKVDSTGQETVLYSFCSVANCTDGSTPYAGLIQDAAGNLYGTTLQGGTSNFNCFVSQAGCGTVFKVDSTGNETVLYRFCPNGGLCSDGQSTEAGLIQDTAGNLYGTTPGGGANGYGTVFKVDSAGHETVLYSFCSEGGYDCTDGSGPQSGLIQDHAGNLYGTTFGGGADSSRGTIFELDAAGHETVLYNFCSEDCSDGYYPLAGVLLDAAGNLYGTAPQGGSNNSGTVFRLVLGGGGGGTATVTLTSNQNPSFVDQSVTFSAVVSGSGATPTGSVAFEEGKIVLGTVTLADGLASFTTTFTKSGKVSIIACYSGDQNYKAKNSKALKQVVDQYTTSTALSSSLNPSTYGQMVTFTATVSSEGPTPTGSVTFKNGSQTLGSVSLSGGVAQVATAILDVGTSTITASYSGDTRSAKSESSSLKQIVNQATSTTTLVSSVNPSKVGKKVKFTATVTSPTSKPTGTVTFVDGSEALATGIVAAGSGKASYSTSALSAGSHNITAVYDGTPNIKRSTSPVLVQTVN